MLTRILLLMLIITLITGCSPAPNQITPELTTIPSPTATLIPTSVPTATPTPKPIEYTLRVELLATDDWNELTFINKDSISRLIEKGRHGPINYINIARNRWTLNQSRESAEAREEIGVIVDLVFEVDAINKPFTLHLERGSLNESVIRFYKVSDNGAEFLQEIKRQGWNSDDPTGHNPYDFTVDLKQLARGHGNIPVRNSAVQIGPENLKGLQEIAHFYAKDITYLDLVTKDGKTVFVGDGGGVNKYEYPAMTGPVHVPIPLIPVTYQDFDYRPGNYLQTTDDGKWLLIMNRWLVEFTSGDQFNIRDLKAEFHLKNGYHRILALSPKGTQLVIVDTPPYSCSRNVESRVINLQDNSVRDVLDLPGCFIVISPDGQYIAASRNRVDIDNRDNGHIMGAWVDIWNSKDLKKISTITVPKPYVVKEISFSLDGRLVAISQYQSSAVNYYDAASGTDVSAPPLSAWAKKIPIPYPYPSSDFEAGRVEDFHFINDTDLAFKISDPCMLSLAESSFQCKPILLKYRNQQYIGTGHILGTDGQYYSYKISPTNVDIFSPVDGSKVYYSIPWKNSYFWIQALDPINNLIIYEVALGGGSNHQYIRDMNNDNVVLQLDDALFNQIVSSRNGKTAAICQMIGNDWEPNSDKLVIFDLAQRNNIYKTDFSCQSAAIAVSDDGTKVAVEHYQSYSMIPEFEASTRILYVDASNGIDIKKIDLEEKNANYAVGFLPDGKLLAAACYESKICFLDPTTGEILYQMDAYPGIRGIAFSPEGTRMAISTEWGLISVWGVPPFDPPK